ncbi:MAG: SDR family oxidoreductase [Deltaproteobacteria bacterium]|nr:SDR family oxidoreductase [Deltaproteobacteria bacterium]
MFQPGLLKNKTILITGGGTGLGKSMALRFAELGANLVLAGRREEVLREASTEIKNKGAKVFFKAADVRNYDQVEAVFDAAEKEFGKIDVLVNNAAGNFISPTEFLSPNAFNAVVGIVLNGTFHATQAAGRRWINQQCGGRVLNIITTYAWTGSAYVVPSACAKAGVLAMTRSLAVEWGKYKIRLNAIAPGPFPTEQAWKNLVPEGFEEKWRKRIPLGRTGRHEELSNLAAYLVSDYADYINGEVATIDGGEWISGAGQFNMLTEMTPEDWALMAERAKGSRLTKS